MISESPENFYSAIIFNLEEFQTYVFSHNLNSQDLGYFLYSEDALGINIPEYYEKKIFMFICFLCIFLRHIMGGLLATAKLGITRA